ncbi:hypothetical protein BDY19DRAFT_1056906, partial [Irpex rosettiformis]
MDVDAEVAQSLIGNVHENVNEVDRRSMATVNHCSTQFPSDDILYHIFSLCDPKVDKEHRNTWLACSLVCRQWYTVALPYVFRSLCIGLRHHRHLKHKDLMVDYVQFLSENPHIPKFIHTLCVCYVEIDISAMHTLLGLLPHLRYLYLTSVKFYNSGAPIPEARLRENKCALRKVHLSSFKFYPAEFCHFTDVLGLFDEIEEVTVVGEIIPQAGVRQSEHPNGEREEDIESISDVAAAKALAGNSGRLQCRALFFSNGIYSSSFLPSFLLKVGALQHLSSLVLIVMDDVRCLERLNRLLSLSASTLKFLCLKFIQGPRWFGGGGSKTHREIEQVRSQLKACLKLEELRLYGEISLDSIYRSMKMHSLPRQPIYVEAFRSVVTMTSLVPGNALHNLEFSFSLSKGRSYGHFCAHWLPWSEMREVCSRFRGLRSLKITLVIDSEYKDSCLNYEMQDFANILTAPPPGNLGTCRDCRNVECRRYKEKPNTVTVAVGGEKIA